MSSTESFSRYSVQWRHALVRLDRLVPLQALHFTSKAPYPIVLQLPSRGKHKISVHVYVPPPPTRNCDAGLPALLDFHGGGFIMGSCLEQAPFCSIIARRTGSVVVSVDYRMGPRHRFPAAIHDAEDVLAAMLNPASSAGMILRKAIAQKLNPPQSSRDVLDASRISLSGFSSGGNIALNLAISIKTDSYAWPSLFPASSSVSPVRSIPVLLFFPSFDQRLLPHERPMPAHLRKDPNDGAKPSGLKLSQVLGPTYLSKAHRQHLRANPGLADMRHGLHPDAKIFLVLPEIDSLGPQSETWLRKMEDEGRRGCVRSKDVRAWNMDGTQFPDVALGKKAKKEKMRMFERAVEFLNATDQHVNGQRHEPTTDPEDMTKHGISVQTMNGMQNEAS